MKMVRPLIAVCVLFAIAGCDAEFTVPFTTRAVDPELAKRAFNEAPECAKFNKSQTTLLDERDPQASECLTAIDKLLREYEQAERRQH